MNDCTNEYTGSSRRENQMKDIAAKDAFLESAHILVQTTVLL
jgi:hypothetical protein